VERSLSHLAESIHPARPLRGKEVRKVGGISFLLGGGLLVARGEGERGNFSEVFFRLNDGKEKAGNVSTRGGEICRGIIPLRRGCSL